MNKQIMVRRKKPPAVIWEEPEAWAEKVSAVFSDYCPECGQPISSVTPGLVACDECDWSYAMTSTEDGDEDRKHR